LKETEKKKMAVTKYWKEDWFIFPMKGLKLENIQLEVTNAKWYKQQ
jgi:hypothetical protein